MRPSRRSRTPRAGDTRWGHGIALASLIACSGSKTSRPARDDASAPGSHDGSVPADASLALADPSWRRSHDFDGDGKRDAVTIDYTNGAHCCYRLTVSLSANERAVAIPFDIDGGYAEPGGLSLARPENFTVEVGGDGVSSFVMSIATYGGRGNPIPLEWVRRYGVRSHRVRVSLRGGELRVDNLGWDCDSALEALTHRRLALWEGWPVACDLAEISTVLDVTRAPGNDGTLGADKVEVTHDRVSTMVTSDARYVTLDLSQRDGHVVRIDLDEPTFDARDLVEDLGAPDARLPYTMWGFTHPTGQWVWPSRGLVVYVDRANRVIRRAGVFAPTDLASYQRELAWP